MNKKTSNVLSKLRPITRRRYIKHGMIWLFIILVYSYIRDFYKLLKPLQIHKYKEFQHRKKNISISAASLLRPPGAVEEKEFLKRCIMCNLCAMICPVACIELSDNIRIKGYVTKTPYVIARKRGCTMCLKCTHACPTQALLPLKSMNEVAMGKAQIDKDLCLPYIGISLCGACITICPVNAISIEMQRYPVVLEKICTGCGLCEDICLAENAAIIVNKVAS